VFKLQKIHDIEVTKEVCYYCKFVAMLFAL